MVGREKAFQMDHPSKWDTRNRLRSLDDLPSITRSLDKNPGRALRELAIFVSRVISADIVEMDVMQVTFLCC
jgi:hypothetical protein